MCEVIVCEIIVCNYLCVKFVCVKLLYVKLLYVRCKEAGGGTQSCGESATPATQNDGGCEFVPRLPRDIKVDVTKCHACHAKWESIVCEMFVCVKLLYVRLL